VKNVGDTTYLNDVSKLLAPQIFGSLGTHNVVTDTLSNKASDTSVPITTTVVNHIISIDIKELTNFIGKPGFGYYYQFGPEFHLFKLI
jgi:hypothetical protein